MNQNVQKNKLVINSYQSSSEKEFSKNKKNNLIKSNPEINLKKGNKRNYSKKDYRKKEYIISVNNILNQIQEKVKSKQSKMISKSKITELSNFKNISKEKTMNNTFNTYNTYSNMNNNMNQNSNSNNTYINIAINNSSVEEFSKNEENSENIDKTDEIKNNDNNSTKMRLQTSNDFNINIDKYFDSKNQDLPYFREYYTTKDKIKELDQTRTKLFLSSQNFYLRNKNRAILSKINKLKNKDIEKELKQLGYDYTYSKKLNIYSDLKRLPTSVCFGKGVSSMKAEDEDKEIYQKTFLKNLENKRKENQVNLDNFHKLMTKGFCCSKKNINKYDAILENKLIINSNSTRKYKKKNQIVTGQNLYPLLKEKKILKNILPKEIDYNTQFTINDVLNEEIHPLYRYQKKNINFHSRLISHEIGFLFVKTFALGKMVSRRQDIINKKMDEKFNILSKILIEKGKEMAQSKKKLSDKENMKILRRKYLLEKFETVIKKAFYQFRRMKTDIRTFLTITKNDIPIKYEEGLYLFRAIKDLDLENIEQIIKKNYHYALFRDEFGQTAMHICAKRNMYQVISLLISRLGDVNAQDIYGRTPLMCAVEKNHLDTVCVLLFNYADPDITDKKGKRAIDYLHIRKKLLNKNEFKIKRMLEYIRVVYLFHRMMANEKDFDTFIMNSLKYLMKGELDINYEDLLKINEEVLMDDKEKKSYIKKYV